MPRVFAKAFALASVALLSVAGAAAQAPLKVVTDHTSYNVGSEVGVHVFPTSEAAYLSGLHLRATIRYAGESKPVADQISLDPWLKTRATASSTSPAGNYLALWRIPSDARTGRFEIDVHGQGASAFELPRAASFVVHRKLIRIDRVELDKTFYTSGDPVACAVPLRNLTDHGLSDLRLEFSVRYWPWTAQSSERSGVDYVSLAESLALAAGEAREIRSARAAVAADVKQPTVLQYAAVVWDHERKGVLDIAFSPLVFINPPGVDTPRPYAGVPGSAMQYLHPDLGAVNVLNYRHFYPPQLDSSAIQFDRSHTMFGAGSAVPVSFTVARPKPTPWRGVSIHARLLDPAGAETEAQLVEASANIDAGASPLKKEVKFALPAGSSGIYRAQVEVSDAAGQILAVNSLELGVNPLPKSVLVFCAHEDDEGAHYGIIRAAVENHVPIHFVYFTSGDSGSCDRYYQRSCGPAEALNFGALRMEEARAALGHLGVARGDINFLGLPDGGSGQIWQYHVQPSNPYLSVLLASDHAPYEGLARPNLPYARNSVVEAAKEFIRKLQPEVIYTGHPDERHVDHRTNNWFVVKALLELAREGALASLPALLVDQSYGPGPQERAPYHYQKHVFHISGEAVSLAQEAQWYYQSQDGNRAEGRLRTFEQLPRSEVHWQVIDWKEHEGWNEKN